MTIGELIQKIKNGVAELKANREADVLIIANNQIALVSLRIQSRGEDADGSPFIPYTPDYAKTRKAAGYQIGFVDFTRTGRTLASVKARITASSIFSASVVIEPDNDESKAIVKGLSNKRGDILALSQDELLIIKAANRRRINKYFDGI